MRANPRLDLELAITELGTGEALVSCLDEKGRPSITERAFIVPPGSKLGPITAEERKIVIESSAIYGHYEKLVDRESAYEKLTQRVAESAQPAKSVASSGTQQAPPAESGGLLGALGNILRGSTGPRGGRREGAVEAATKSAARAIGSQVGREIIRGVLGSIFGGGRRR
jgi:DNA helicase HerA-like ATPase